MMVFPLIGLAIAAAVVSRETGLFGPAVANAIASFWGNGVMYNFAHDPQTAPNWAAGVSMLTTVVSLMLLGAALITS